jgi:predicted enzyme related to lactoylglutathione lyase
VPTRHGAPLGAPIWIDLSSSDTDRAQEFYGMVFGWTFEAAGPDYGGYINASKDGHPVAGLMFNDPQWRAPESDVAGPAAPDGWSTYFHTADINATVAASRAAGGTSCVEPMEVKGKGWMAMGTDPSGAFFGLWQPTGHHGYEVFNEPGAPVWHELTTRDFAKAVDFYRNVLGWQVESVSDTDDFRYATAVLDGEQLLGVMDGGKFLPEGVPSNWLFYLGAEDVDKTLELITENGGKVLRPADDTPYGRLAQVADPTGAVFNLSSLRE